MLWIMAPVRNVYFLTGIANCGSRGSPMAMVAIRLFIIFIRAAAKTAHYHLPVTNSTRPFSGAHFEVGSS